MHFTREPIVQTVITPREGFKLVIRNSKTSGVEEYLVDAVEVVTFGEAIFYRSLERPKHFLLPVADYEVLEVRETRMVLKTATAAEKPAAKKEEAAPERKKRRQRRKKTEEAPAPKKEEPKAAEEPKPQEEAKAPAPLIPPPTSLISENIDRYKELVREEKPVVTPAAAAEPEKTSFSASRFLRRLTGREGEE